MLGDLPITRKQLRGLARPGAAIGELPRIAGQRPNLFGQGASVAASRHSGRRTVSGSMTERVRAWLGLG